MISQLAEALEPEVPVAAQRQQRTGQQQQHRTTRPHQNFDKFNLLSQIWNAPDHSYKVGGLCGPSGVFLLV